MLDPIHIYFKFFFDAKSDEIVSVFSGGPKVEFDSTLSILKKYLHFLILNGNK